MAREHHCPNCGAQACNASTSKIHTCGVCAAIWEEDLSVPAPAPKPPVAPAPPAPKPTAAPTPASAPAPVPAPTLGPAAATKPAAPPQPTTIGAKPLSTVLGDAKVKRCPKCTSDSLAAPSDYRTVGGRLVLVDSQTYRGHAWYADTGELLPAADAASAAPAPATHPAA